MWSVTSLLQGLSVGQWVGQSVGRSAGLLVGRLQLHAPIGALVFSACSFCLWLLMDFSQRDWFHRIAALNGLSKAPTNKQVELSCLSINQNHLWNQNRKEHGSATSRPFRKIMTGRDQQTRRPGDWPTDGQTGWTESFTSPTRADRTHPEGAKIKNALDRLNKCIWKGTSSSWLKKGMRGKIAKE